MTSCAALSSKWRLIAGIIKLLNMTNLRLFRDCLFLSFVLKMIFGIVWLLFDVFKIKERQWDSDRAFICTADYRSHILHTGYQSYTVDFDAF